MNEIKQPVTDVLQTKCRGCGGMTEFSPKDQTLKCVYCGSSTVLDLTPAKVKENDFGYWAARSDEDLASESIEATEVRCKQCGAVTTLPPERASSNCAFCGTPLILNEAVINRFWQPNYILPFKVDKRECGGIFQKWLGKKWFLPSQLKKGNVQTERFKGIYMPFWTYDADTSTNYRGERGINRTVTSRNAKGEEVKRTVTDWYNVSGRVNLHFDDIVVPASDSLPPKIMNRLTNWDQMNCVPYRQEFLAGFMTNIYNIDFRDGVHVAKEKMEQVIEDNIKSDIGGDKQRVRSKDVFYQNLMFKLLLLPIWVSAFRYNGRLYQFVVNGRTGQVTGEYPKDTMKIIMLVAAIITFIAALMLIFG
jgi:ribosomal protein S27E